jgi:hypothetical protein
MGFVQIEHQAGTPNYFSQFTFAFSLLNAFALHCIDSSPATITGTSKVSTSGGTLTLAGTFFQPLNLSIDSVLVTPTSISATTIVCTVPSGNGGNHVAAVTSGVNGCQKTINATWSYLLLFV